MKRDAVHPALICSMTYLLYLVLFFEKKNFGYSDCLVNNFCSRADLGLFGILTLFKQRFSDQRADYVYIISVGNKDSYCSKLDIIRYVSLNQVLYDLETVQSIFFVSDVLKVFGSSLVLYYMASVIRHKMEESA